MLFHKSILLILVLLLIALFGCSDTKTSTDTSENVIYTSIAPLAFLAEAIAGEEFKIEVLIKAGQTPHTFQPSPQQIASISQADLLLTTGFPFEDIIVSKLQTGGQNLTIAKVDDNIVPVHSDHEHDHDHSHHLTDSDPHIWLSPLNAKIIAENIYQILSKLYPDKSESFVENLKIISTKLDQIHARIVIQLKPYQGQSVYVYHPAFGHFTESYHLKQVAVEIEGKSPSPKQIESLIAKARADNVHILFVQPQFDSKSAQVIAQAINGQVIAIDPLEKNLLENFILIAVNFEKSLQQTK